MALDWIKLDHSTLNKPELMRIARRLGVTKQHVLGMLMYVWSWLDEQTESDVVGGAVGEDLDEVAGQAGLADAMVSVGWLEVTDDGLRFPGITEKYGATARKRALDARRKLQQYRSGAEKSGEFSKRRGEVSEADGENPDQEQEQAQAQAVPAKPTNDHSEKGRTSRVQPGGLVPAVPATPTPTGGATDVEDLSRRRIRAIQLLEQSPINGRFKRRAMDALITIEEGGRDPCAILADLRKRSGLAVKPGNWMLKALEIEAYGESAKN